MLPANWHTITQSEFPWEREALDFLRERLPNGEIYRAWSNFEFISDTGAISEVDLLVLTPQGLFLIEIKSRPGVVTGDAQTWTWRNEGKSSIYDNPLLLANRKAKKLAALIKRQKAAKGVYFPFIEPIVFCSHPSNQIQLSGVAGHRVCLRDRDPQQPSRPGVIAALTRRDFDGAAAAPPATINRPVAKAITLALDQAGIRPSQKSRKVGDYILGALLYESPTGSYQDWEATHASIKTSLRRVRIYNVARNANDIDRLLIRKAAQREYQILESLAHPGILGVESFTEHELGPALIFRHDPDAVRLDHFLSQRSAELNVDVRLGLMRQIAEALKYAHENRVIHRALCPQSILVVDPDSAAPKIKIFNWQTGYRESSTSNPNSTGLGRTLHPEQFIEDASTVYMAPEAASRSETIGEYLDIFSLGAIAWRIFTGQPPATGYVELLQKIRDGKGLQISNVIDGAGSKLQDLILYSTQPEVILRYDTVNDFLAQLDEVEDELTTPDSQKETVADPREARVGDRLEGGFVIRGRLGSGSTSVVFLIDRNERNGGDGRELVLKLASQPEHNDRLREEAETVRKLRHPNIVEACDTVEIGELVGYTMQRATTQKASSHEGAPVKALEGTLAQRLRAEGRLHLELLQRFGDDLLSAVKYLEEIGVPHRDLKPDNIGIRPLGRGDRLHLVIFDFSLSRTPVDNIRAGTAPYLEPFLLNRKPRLWDLYAERYAAAVTLYEMATGTLPRWADGQSNPEVLDCEATLHTDLFDPQLRDAMTAFFQKALRRDYRERFDNAEEMQKAWGEIFISVHKPASGGEATGFDLAAILQQASLQTPVITLGLSTRAANALDRINAITVLELLRVPAQRLFHLRGIGSKTRQEVTKLVAALREKFPDIEQSAPAAESTPSADGGEPEVAGVDLIAQQVAGATAGTRAKAGHSILHAFLGWTELNSPPPIVWISQIELGRRLNLTRARIGQVVTRARARWAKNPSITSLRQTVCDLIEAHGGVMSSSELCEALLAARGSSEEEPRRSRLAAVILRAAVEAEASLKTPRFVAAEAGRGTIVAASDAAIRYLRRLGRIADDLAALDPLPTIARSLEDLRAVEPPAGMTPLPDSRLVGLAAAASKRAAVSSRLEIYPRGMPAAHALKLAQGALTTTGKNGLKPDEIRQRVSGRYPEAEPLPDRPALDALLVEAGSELQWIETPDGGVFRYTSANLDSGLTSSTEHYRFGAVVTPGGSSTVDISPDVADARIFENKLRRAETEGAFLALTVSPRYLLRAETELMRRFEVERCSVDEALIGAMKRTAAAAGADWSVVLKADASPAGGLDWNNLMILVGRSLPTVEQRLSHCDRTLLLTCPGLLSRYDQLGLLERLRDRIGRAESTLHGLWVLIPCDEQSALPMLDGKPVPVISSAQWARIPEAWILNRHRGGEENAEHAE